MSRSSGLKQPLKMKEQRPKSVTPTSRKRPKKLDPRTSSTSLDVARWFIQENESDLPVGFYGTLHGAIRARDVPTIRKVADKFGTPQLYGCPNQYSVVAQSLALVTKVAYPFGGGDAGRKEQALEKFHKSELLCRISTRRLRYYWDHPDREDPVMRQILTKARVLVDSVLGSIDNALPRIVESCRFGPGMTVCSTDSARTTPYYKFEAERWSVTATARPYASLAVCQSPQWVSTHGEIDWTNQTVRLPWNTVQSCRLTFVPKDERTFRTIAIEPYGNVLVQLGVHEYLTERLRTHAGIDIRSQEWNQKAAARGSRDWLSVDTVSTIDLSSASDCISPGLVSRLVRPQWYGFLDDLRSKSYLNEEVETPFSKWSSMGNGYTFALETLLFWALAQSCEEYCETGQRSLVYGDDIISSRQCSLLVLQVLRYCGLIFNPTKTCIVGPFRESCGEDYHTGVSVRPVFLDKFQLEAPDVFVLMNTLGKGATFSTDEVYLNLLESIPPPLRLFGPVTRNTDSHIHAPWWWLHATRPAGFRFNRGDQSHYHRRLTFKSKVFSGSEGVKYLTWLYSTGGGRKPLTRDLTGRPVLAQSQPRTLSDAIDRALGSPTAVQVTQRSRGTLRFCSARCHVSGTTDRSYFYLAMG